MKALWTTALAMVLLLGGCAQRPAEPTLYQQLGGKPGVAMVVESLMYRIADDPQLIGFFTHTNIDHFVASLEEQLCDLADGPCHYQGPPMDRAHQHMGIDNADFNRLVGHMEQAMIDEGIALGARNRLLRRLAPLHGEIMRYQTPPPTT
ncbi:group 1 truncated hemoglobin [Halomonas chromatireducens]|uniref:Group 1 truncated hemoglobin GlbN n=1 Tax=Halomonas chromatireducens TaxID=507626 RepID=A0A0X8HD58_9GAMM|nr:group 1 truncated hemoglobin [Halomonas chromatireducens]AMD00436.1 Group 1 truncated hemoglobin GlbN [Halomonas chromatireducens]